MLRHLCLLLSLLALIATCQAQLPDGVQKLDLTVDGVARSGFVYTPSTAKETPAPVVFVWHGHGGTAQNAARSFAMYQHMPEAISVYLQGLNTPGQLTDPEGKKPGWQHAAGAQALCVGLGLRPSERQAPPCGVQQGFEALTTALAARR